MSRKTSSPATGVSHWGNALFILPFLLCYFFLLIFPVFKGFWLSLHEVDQLSEASEFVGLANFKQLLDDDIFRGSVCNTFYFILLTTPAFVVLGLILALALNRPGKLGTALRATFFGSSVLSVTIVTLIWRLVFMPDRGMLANIMRSIGITPIAPLTSESLALPTVAFVTVWWIVGLPMMLFLSSLQQIPQELYEAAALDNSSRWRTFSSITLPSIKRTLVLVAIIEVILQFQLFGQSQLMTMGGPNNSSRSIVMFIYDTGFKQWQLGTSAAAAQILFALMLIGVAAQMLVSRKRDG